MRIVRRCCKKHLFNGINFLYEKDVTFYIRKSEIVAACYVCDMLCYYILRQIVASIYITYEQELKIIINKKNLIGIFNIKEDKDNE